MKFKTHIPIGELIEDLLKSDSLREINIKVKSGVINIIPVYAYKK